MVPLILGTPPMFIGHFLVAMRAQGMSSCDEASEIFACGDTAVTSIRWQQVKS